MNAKGFVMLAAVVCGGFCARVEAQDTLDALLAGYPAQSVQQAEELSARFAALGAGAVTDALNRLVPMGTADDNSVRYALSGLAKYAGVPGREVQRAMFSKALCEALPAETDLDVQQFLISLLHWIGNDDAVPALSACLATPGLTKPSSEALAAIATQDACDALATALAAAEDDALPVIITALGAAGCEKSVRTLRPLAKSDDAKTREAACYALATLGDAGSARVIEAATNAEGGVVEERLRLADSLIEGGKRRKAASIAKDVLANAASPHEIIAAMNVLAQARGERALDTVLGLLDNESSEVRCAAIRTSLSSGGERARAALLAELNTTSPGLRADLLRTLAQSGVREARPAAEQDLTHTELDVRLAAIDALVMLAGSDAFSTLLARREIDGSADGPEFQALDRALEATTPSPGAPLGAADAEGFVPLFNGKDLTGWVGETAGYAVEDGAMVCKTGRKIYAMEEYADFVLRLEFRLVAESNNGVGIRMAPGTHAATRGMEIQVLDDTAAKYADLNPYQFCGAIYGVVAPEKGHLKPLGEWNEMEITANGPQITVKINGATVADANVIEVSANGTPDEKEHPGLQRKSGRIAFLGHQTEVGYRNIRVKRINAE